MLYLHCNRLVARSLAARVVAALVLLAWGTGGLAQAPGTPTVDFSPSSYTVQRTDGVVTLTLTLSQASANPVTVQWATRPQDSTESATPGEDFVPSSGTVVFPPGSVSQQIQVVIIPNQETQQEFFWVDLSNAQNATLGIIPAEVFIQGTAPPPAAVSFDYASWSYSEAKVIATISVTMTGSPTGPVSVNYATGDGTAKAGVNYLPASGVLTWQASEVNVSKTFTVPLIDDGTVDPTLTVNLTLSGPVNAVLGSQATAILNILDADAPCP